jgi:hypothetical protein
MKDINHITETFAGYPATAKIIDLLAAQGIHTLTDLSQQSEHTLRSWQGMGTGKIALIQRVLQDHGLALR